jgi:hypothetical protein
MAKLKDFGVAVETSGKGNDIVHKITLSPKMADVLVSLLGKSAFLEDNAVGTKMPAWAKLSEKEGAIANNLVNELSSDWSK